MKGYVYILTHDRMPGLVKIGCTENQPSQRIAEINMATGVPGRFKEFCSFEVSDAFGMENIIHKKLSPYRYLSNKEFFEIKPEVAKQYVEKIIEGADFGVEFDKFTMVLCEDMTQLGKIICKHRKLNKITHKELAMVACCGVRFLVEIEKGKPTAQIGKIFSVLKALRLRMVIDFA